MKGQSLEQEKVVTPSRTVLRPHAHLFKRGLIAIFALTTPVFAVLYWLTIPDGVWPLVLAIHILVVVVVTLAVLSYFSTTIQFVHDGVRERGFFGRTIEVRHSMVGAIVLIDLYEGSTLDTQPQLFVTGTDGRVLIRMRGQFWALADMERVAEELDVPITKRAESVTLTELRRTSPELLYWFERFPRVSR
ncbi:hypothetical protein [Leifsonia poae]|uniref:hypothetical protein n=1 Tax=Leifsonia poae TaxID=110933 RepID=UPI003D669762